MVMFFLPFAFHLCFLSLILMRTDLVVEPSTRWKYQIRPPEDRTPLEGACVSEEYDKPPNGRPPR